jgi:uncharacterized membrane protein YqjE
MILHANKKAALLRAAFLLTIKPTLIFNPFTLLSLQFLIFPATLFSPVIS